MRRVTIGGMTMQLYEPEGRSADAPLIVLLGESEEGFQTLVKKAQKLNCALCAVPIADWNGQLSPWSGKAVFRGAEDFSGGADAFLEQLLPVILELQRQMSCDSLMLAGYSLAGLFVLYAAQQTDVFDAIAAMSPSVWYEGYLAYLEAHPVRNTGMKAYLSLGKAEEKTRNPVLRQVGDGVRETKRLLEKQLGREVPLVMQDGGHHYEVAAKIWAGVEWLAEHGAN